MPRAPNWPRPQCPLRTLAVNRRLLRDILTCRNQNVRSCRGQDARSCRDLARARWRGRVAFEVHVADTDPWHHGAVDPSLSVSVIAAAISAVALYVSIKQPFLTQRLSVTQVAADALIESVGAMREAIWASFEVQPDREAIAGLAYAMDRTCRAHQRSLPKGISGLRREVRAAAGNYLGGASGYALDPRLKELPFSDHEDYWWDITTTYLDYVVDTLGAWRNNPQVRQIDLIPFHEWRRGEDADRHAQSPDCHGKMLKFCTCDDPPPLIRTSAEAPTHRQAGEQPI